MNTSWHALTTALVLAACAPWTLTAASEDESAIRQQCAKFVAAWNQHDVKAMAVTWAEDGDIINPFGRHARGRAEIEKLLTDEHATAMRGTTYSTTDVSVRVLSSTVAVSEWSSEVTGMHDPTGAALPVFKHHVVVILEKRHGQWEAIVARPYVFLPAGPPSTN